MEVNDLALQAEISEHRDHEAIAEAAAEVKEVLLLYDCCEEFNCFLRIFLLLSIG